MHACQITPKEIYSGSRDLFRFQKITDKTNGKSYVAYQMASILMASSNTEGHFCCLKPFGLTSRNIICINCDMFTHELERACSL